MAEFRMPSLGADMESGKVIAWHVKPGDRVKRGDIVATVDTSKAEIDVEIFQDGTIGELLVQPGERVPVGTVLATLASQVAEPALPVLPHTAAPPPAPVPAAGPVRATPFARRAAADLGIDLAAVAGSGPNGAVLARDVHPPEKPVAVATSAEEPDRATTMRQAIAAAMARSKREIPHYYLATDIDLTATLDWLAEHNAPLPVAKRALAAVPMLKAVALALRDFPLLNGYWIDGALQPGPAINLGVAVGMRGGGLIAPAIHAADTLSIDELMAALRDLVRRVRSGGLRSSELTDVTLTVTSLGDASVSAVYGVIYPPQVALVGFGAVSERPWASTGMLGVRRAVTATLAADHRASDGHLGAGFLNAIDRLLQNPEQL